MEERERGTQGGRWRSNYSSGSLGGVAAVKLGGDLMGDQRRSSTGAMAQESVLIADFLFPPFLII